MVIQSRGKNPNWKGGRTVDPRGYVLIKQPDHPNADVRGYVYEHILVLTQQMGRPLEFGEEVHHKNENKTDNRPENLELMPSKAQHRYFHRKRKYERPEFDAENELIECACGCGEWLERFDATMRQRTYVSGHNPQRSPARDKILDALQHGPRTSRELCLHGTTEAAAKKALSTLFKDGKVRQIKRGLWELDDANRN